MQTSYNFTNNVAFAGGIADLAPYAIDTFLNEEATGDMKFGYGVVKGTAAGEGVKIPTANTDVFEGVTVNNRTTELDTEGALAIKNKAAIGVMRYGNIWVQVPATDAIAYNDAVYLVYSGDNKGKFSKSSTNAIAVDARFIKKSGGLALIRLNKVGPVVDNDTVYTLPAATASALGGIKVGTGLTVADDGTLSVSQG